ncbi:MAG: hypothetical protein WKF89_07040 [Chitinophagaceae bacterium]
MPLDHSTFWARYRGGDNLMIVYWLYNNTGDKFLLNLACNQRKKVPLIYAGIMAWPMAFMGKTKRCMASTQPRVAKN